jgi:hypothetical protein
MEAWTSSGNWQLRGHEGEQNLVLNIFFLVCCHNSLYFAM